MRSFWLALRIAVLFLVLLTIALAATFHLFGRVEGRWLFWNLGRLAAHEGTLVAERMETLFAEGKLSDLDDPEAAALLHAAAREGALDLALLSPGGELLVSTGPRPLRRLRHHSESEIVVRGRRCRLLGPPLLEAQIPVFVDGKRAATVAVGSRLHSPEAHRAFLVGLLQIGAVVFVGVVALSLFLTAPLRQMSRSMDRIADGDLDHRVPARGRGEVASMGRSFNSMAERIRSLLLGQKELLAGVSHELRSPLARMKVSLELLRDGGADERRVADLETDVDAVDALVEELLVASRLDLGAASVDRQILDLHEVARRAWGRVADAGAARGAELKVELQSDAEAIWADRGLALRILGNLFENAVRHGRGVVLLRSRRRGDRVEIRVADEGAGVDEARLEHLFEPFYRVDPSRSRRTGGTGLGLMIVRRAVEAHGGTAMAQRAQTGGLEIVLTLPAPTGGSSDTSAT